jgi:membrane protease subunit HflK
MVRMIARQAEAERERRAKVISAEGEQQAAQKLLEAADILSRRPEAMQLHYLGALSVIANDRASTIVFPVPVDLPRLMSRIGDEMAAGAGIRASGPRPTAGRAGTLTARRMRHSVRDVADRFGDFPRRNRSDDPLSELRDLVDSLRERFGGGGGGNGSRPGGGRPVPVWPFVAIALVLWLATGIFIVAPDERGIVLRFGKVVREAEPGPGYHLPWPMEEVLKPSVTQIRKEEFGYRTVDLGPPARYRNVDPEALMLTGDENIVKLLFIVQYKVKADPEAARDFLFNVRDPRETVRAAAEAAMRQVVGRNQIDDVLTEQRDRVQREARDTLQQVLDAYGVGLDVVAVQLQDVDPPDQVSDAFKDVISAQQDRERMVNEARGYANDVVPKARGHAAQMLNEAEGYRQARIEEATGAAQRFIALHDEYTKAPDVTRLRLYLETMEEVLPRVDKVLVDEVAGRQAVPYLPLDQLLPRLRPGEPAARAGAAAGEAAPARGSR